MQPTGLTEHLFHMITFIIYSNMKPPKDYALVTSRTENGKTIRIYRSIKDPKNVVILDGKKETKVKNIKEQLKKIKDGNNKNPKN